jgi:hypothetical protein
MIACHGIDNRGIVGGDYLNGSILSRPQPFFSDFLPLLRCRNVVEVGIEKIINVVVKSGHGVKTSSCSPSLFLEDFTGKEALFTSTAITQGMILLRAICILPIML